MDKPKKPRTAWDPRRVPLHRRIRNRREELGLTAAQLADRVEVSPSYISLIENGEKIPGEDVAARIALALRDDPGLYVAWTHTTRHEDPERQLRDLVRLHTLSSDPALLARLESGEDLEEADPPEEDGPAFESVLDLIEQSQSTILREESPASHALRFCSPSFDRSDEDATTQEIERAETKPPHDLEAEEESIAAESEETAEQIETKAVKAKKADIAILDLWLLWS